MTVGHPAFLDGDLKHLDQAGNAPVNLCKLLAVLEIPHLVLHLDEVEIGPHDGQGRPVFMGDHAQEPMQPLHLFLELDIAVGNRLLKAADVLLLHFLKRDIDHHDQHDRHALELDEFRGVEHIDQVTVLFVQKDLAVAYPFALQGGHLNGLIVLPAGMDADIGSCAAEYLKKSVAEQVEPGIIDVNDLARIDLLDADGYRSIVENAPEFPFIFPQLVIEPFAVGDVHDGADIPV